MQLSCCIRLDKIKSCPWPYWNLLRRSVRIAIRLQADPVCTGKALGRWAGTSWIGACRPKCVAISVPYELDRDGVVAYVINVSACTILTSKERDCYW